MFDEIEDFIAQIPTLDRVIPIHTDVPADNLMGKLMVVAVSILSNQTVIHYFGTIEMAPPSTPPTMESMVWGMEDDLGTDYGLRGAGGGGGGSAGFAVMATTFDRITIGAREIRLLPPGRLATITVNLPLGTVTVDREDT